jgi:hypothetical protein
MHGVCVLASKCVYFVLESPEALHPPDLFAHALSGTTAFSLGFMPFRLPLGTAPALIGSPATPLPSLKTAQWFHNPPSAALTS